ncbi:hypothetical protein OCOJLMKI_5294 [Methylobacterium iners]|uniref:Uncharacterized protein n=1 Tax=Methylobacterium iners TaxID=418707 RepID=A0ABQ4S8R2_9HYPH|nr:hypothetical protein OCOJLMKI_5294 [Methylobacterium iners]
MRCIIVPRDCCTIGSVMVAACMEIKAVTICKLFLTR